jgi:hypothetical protein
MRMNEKPNITGGIEVEYLDESTTETKANASGGQSRAMIRENWEPEPMHHRMTQEFIDFARIITEKDAAAANDYMKMSLKVIHILEETRKSAGIVFGVDKE